MTTTTDFTGFGTTKFAVNTDGFQNTFNGTFSVVESGNSLDLEYLAIPEPGTFAMLLGGLGVLLGFRQLRRPWKLAILG